MHEPGGDRYRTIDDGSEVEWRVMGSRFLGQALHCSGEAEAHEHVDAARRRHHAATHHVWALRAGAPGSVIERHDDDGEPAGTAGLPLLGRLRARSIHEAVVVVTRYFGGTQLGTGGLARAYAAAADLALAAAPVRERVLALELGVECRFEDLGTVEAVIARAGADVLRVVRAYDPAPHFVLAVPRSRGPELAAAILEATGGRARVRNAPA